MTCAGSGHVLGSLAGVVEESRRVCYLGNIKRTGVVFDPVNNLVIVCVRIDVAPIRE